MLPQILAVLLSGAVLGHKALACSTVFIPQSAEKVMGKSYDWNHNDGMLVVNKRGLSKAAFQFPPGKNPAKWTSRYGSVTFNQHGREFPLGGMNEAGLAIEVMWLDNSGYPASDGRPELNELQWIQYQLDTSSTVHQVVQNAGNVRVAKTIAPVHYLVCDKSGACATIEFLGGHLNVHKDNDLSVPVLTNDSYADSVRHLANFAGFGGTQPIPTGSDSLSRFVRAAHLARQYDPHGSIAAETYAFDILESVRQTGTPRMNSQWNIAYSLASGRISFRLPDNSGSLPPGAKPPLQSLDISRLNFSCTQPTMILELDGGLSGDIGGRFAAYRREVNQRVIQRGLRGAGAQLPQSAIDMASAYPESFHCEERPPASGRRAQPASSEIPSLQRLQSIGLETLFGG